MPSAIISLREFLPEDQNNILEILTDHKTAETYMLPDFAKTEDAIPLFQRFPGKVTGMSAVSASMVLLSGS